MTTTYSLDTVPRGTTRGRIVRWFVVSGLFLGLIAAGSIAAGLASGSGLQIALSLTIATVVVLLLALAAVSSRAVLSSDLHVTEVEAGIELPGSRAAYVCGAGFAVGTALSAVLLVVIGLRAPSTRALLFGLLLLVAAAPLLVRAVTGRYRSNSLQLTPEAVVVLAPRRHATVPWGDVVEVTTPQGKDVQVRTVGPVPWDRTISRAESVWRASDDLADITLTGLSLHSGVQPVADLLAFYAAHPEHRHELGDGTVHDRLARGDVPPRDGPAT